MTFPNLPKPAFGRLALVQGQPDRPYQEVADDSEAGRARQEHCKRVCQALDASREAGMVGYWRYLYEGLYLASSLKELRAAWEHAYRVADRKHPNFLKLEGLKEQLKPEVIRKHKND
jgi:hypothetical protein